MASSPARRGDGTEFGVTDVYRADTSAAGAEELGRLFEALYDELRRLARRRLRGERPDHTLCTTALVHESYLKLGRLDRVRWRSRSHFFAEASRAMRRVLVDHAVRRGAQKRGGARVRVELSEGMAVTDPTDDQLLALDRALEALARTRPRPARVVECRLFAGMTVPEIAEAMDVSPATVKRDWELARAWLNWTLEDGTARGRP
jgi:RNA polymerase sigma-70 factor, ECF subfamily